MSLDFNTYKNCISAISGSGGSIVSKFSKLYHTIVGESPNVSLSDVSIYSALGDICDSSASALSIADQNRLLFQLMDSIQQDEFLVVDEPGYRKEWRITLNDDSRNVVDIYFEVMDDENKTGELGINDVIYWTGDTVGGYDTHSRYFGPIFSENLDTAEQNDIDNDWLTQNMTGKLMSGGLGDLAAYCITVPWSGNEDRAINAVSTWISNSTSLTNEVKDYLSSATANGPNSLIMAISEIYGGTSKLINSGTEANDGFASLAVTVRTFSWGLIASALSTVWQIISMLVTLLSRIAGVIMQLIGTVVETFLKFVLNVATDRTDTLFTINSGDHTPGFRFVVNRGTFTRSSIHQLAESYGGLITVESPIYPTVLLIQSLDEGRVYIEEHISTQFDILNDEFVANYPNFVHHDQMLGKFMRFNANPVWSDNEAGDGLFSQKFVSNVELHLEDYYSPLSFTIYDRLTNLVGSGQGKTAVNATCVSRLCSGLILWLWYHDFLNCFNTFSHYIAGSDTLYTGCVFPYCEGAGGYGTAYWNDANGPQIPYYLSRIWGIAWGTLLYTAGITNSETFAIYNDNDTTDPIISELSDIFDQLNWVNADNTYGYPFIGINGSATPTGSTPVAGSHIYHFDSDLLVYQGSALSLFGATPRQNYVSVPSVENMFVMFGNVRDDLEDFSLNQISEDASAVTSGCDSVFSMDIPSLTFSGYIAGLLVDVLIITGAAVVTTGVLLARNKLLWSRGKLGDKVEKARWKLYGYNPTGKTPEQVKTETDALYQEYRSARRAYNVFAFFTGGTLVGKGAYDEGILSLSDAIHNMADGNSNANSISNVYSLRSIKDLLKH